MIKKIHKVGIFVDASNTGICAYKAFGKRVDYEKLLEFALEDNYLYRAVVYAVRFGDKMEGWCHALKNIGYEVRVKDPTVYASGDKKADWDVGLVMDAVRMIDSIDILVIVSGDGDFIPLVQWAHDKGKIVHMIGIEDSTSRHIKDPDGPVDEYKPIPEFLMLPGRPQEDHKESGDGDYTISLEERAKLDAEIAEAERKHDAEINLQEA